jgi:hypothetical protein
VLVDAERRSDPAFRVPDGAEVALLPPFSGGAGWSGACRWADVAFAACAG